MNHARVAAALSGVLDGVPVQVLSGQDLSQAPNVSQLEVAGRTIEVVWLPVGWPKQVSDALAKSRTPDLIAAPEMSPGARHAATTAGIGWFDETGAANFTLGPTFLVRRDGVPPRKREVDLLWRPATTAVSEALLTGTEATVGAVAQRTGLAMSTVATALKFLEGQSLLQANAARGPRSARTVRDSSALLGAYAIAAARLRSPLSIRVGSLWRDPLDGVALLGQEWSSVGLRWSMTGALTAEALAPLLTQVSPLELYLEVRTLAELRLAARRAGLSEAAGGRLVLRPFPSPAGAALSSEVAPGLWSVPWPRAFADLRITGVRGEEAADHLRERCEHV